MGRRDLDPMNDKKSQKRHHFRNKHLSFSKMHGLGNDFMVLNLVTQNLKITPELVTRWSHRQTGIGFDQLLIVEPPDDPDVDFKYRIFNSDGSEVEQCGNGARCFAKFVRKERLTKKRHITVSLLCTSGGT